MSRKESHTWTRDRNRMVKALNRANANHDELSTAVLNRFSKYSIATKAAVVANYVRGAY